MFKRIGIALLCVAMMSAVAGCVTSKTGSSNPVSVVTTDHVLANVTPTAVKLNTNSAKAKTSNSGTVTNINTSLQNIQSSLSGIYGDKSNVEIPATQDSATTAAVNNDLNTLLNPNKNDISGIN